MKPSQGELIEAMSESYEALRLAHVETAAIESTPHGSPSGYVRAARYFITATKTLETAMLLADQCRFSNSYEEISRAFRHASVARTNVRTARSVVLGSRIEDYPETCLRDSTYIDPARHALMVRIERMWKAANSLESALSFLVKDVAPAATPARGTPPVTRPAKWVAASAVRALPTFHQARYAEEFASELADYARLPRRRQLALAFRQASMVWQLRRNLGTEPQPVPAREG